MCMPIVGAPMRRPPLNISPRIDPAGDGGIAPTELVPLQRAVSDDGNTNNRFVGTPFMASAGGMNAAPTARAIYVLRGDNDLTVTDFVGDSSPERGAGTAQ